MDADEIIASLGLQPHPEGGWFRETWRADAPTGERAAGTNIYFLLKAGERSHWHRVDAGETWHFYLGAPLALKTAKDANTASATHVLGTNIANGERPQIVVPAGFWQSARTTGAFTLVGCTVAPGFEFSGFELASPDFDIPG